MFSQAYQSPAVVKSNMILGALKSKFLNGFQFYHYNDSNTLS